MLEQISLHVPYFAIYQVLSLYMKMNDGIISLDMLGFIHLLQKMGQKLTG